MTAPIILHSWELTAPAPACHVCGMTLKWVPNALTLARCVFAALILYAGWKTGLVTEATPGAEAGELPDLYALEQLWRQFALLAFIAGAFTDFSDGWLARKLDAHSRFGVWLDPIADKLLVGAALIWLCWLIGGWLILLPATVIILRDIAMTLYRLTDRGKSVVHVSQLAKWKTAVEMLAIAGLMLPGALAPRGVEAEAGSGFALHDLFTVFFVGLLWIAAALSAGTAYGYFRAAARTENGRV